VIDLKWLTGKTPEGETHVDMYKKMLEARGEDPKLADRIIELNEERKSNISNFESKKAEQNQASQKFGQAKKNGEAVEELLKELQSLSQTVKELETKSNEATEKIHNHLCFLPNILDEDTPYGTCEEDNPVFKEFGEKTELSFKAKEHWQLGEENKTIDFERAGKVSGSRFSYLRASGAKLERALIQFMLDKHVESGYEEIFPPLMVNAKALFGTSNFPKFQDDVFHIKNKDAYLIPTAEVPITNFYADEILEAENLPQKFVSYTPCFRAEAGSYGKDTKGLIRQHQFNKVELVKFTRPEDSNEEHEKLLESAESILKDLELHYQVVKLCSGDISFGAKKCFDINVWLPGQKAYREISSCSNFGDFQSRRANIRFRAGKGEKPQFIHTLNGSGLAAGRTLVAVYENYQQEDGSIKVPEVLVPYMGGQKVIKVNA